MMAQCGPGAEMIAGSSEITRRLIGTHRLPLMGSPTWSPLRRARFTPLPWIPLGRYGHGAATTTDSSAMVRQVHTSTAGLADLPSDAFAIATAGRFSLAILNDGTCWSWGDNDYGHVAMVVRRSPSPVPFTSSAWHQCGRRQVALALARWRALDTDGDGLSDGEELGAGTNPYYAGDVFETDSMANNGGVVTITWNGKKGKLYEVRRGPDLTDWVLAPSSNGPNQQSIQIAVQNEVMIYSDPAPLFGKAFYRLILESKAGRGEGSPVSCL